MPQLTPRKGMPSPRLNENEFRKRFLAQFQDPAFDALASELDQIVAAAWDAYEHSRKAPRTRKAGNEFADPDYDLSVDWLAARAAIRTRSAVTPTAADQPFCWSTVRPAASTPVRVKCRRRGD
jgi:hypothetical protein